jgi:hypothetical protein
VPVICNVKEAMNLNVKSPAAIFAVSRCKDRVPLKDIKIIYDKIQGSKFGIVQAKSPYAQKYMPEILDGYPVNSNVNPGIGVFCFPEGISIKTQLDMPKWFSFVLTDELGRRSYASCLIFTEELTDKLISSFQPHLIPKSSERFYVEKALCLIGNYPFFTNFKTFLRELYRIQVSNTEIPLERIICHFVDSIYFQKDRALCYQIAEEELKFYKQPLYGSEWDTNDDALEILFITLSIENILLLWEGLLLERKIFLISQSKSLLVNISMSLASLLFPFQWIHVLIPILPEKLKVFTDAPVPVLIGICYKMDLSLFPADSIVINIDNNSVDKYLDRLPKLPLKIFQNMSKRLEKFKDKFKNPDDQNKVLFADEVFNCSGEMLENKEKFRALEVRDIFYEFFILIFKNYEKYFGMKGRKAGPDGKIPPPEFNREYFLKDHSSLEPGSFLYKFTETNIFANFEEAFKVYEHNNIIQFFIDSIKTEKKKDKLYLSYNIPTLSSLVPEINAKDLAPSKKYYYKYFPRLNPDLYNKIDVPKPEYYTKFEIFKGEWCYEIPKKNHRDWVKFAIYNIYEIWYQLFSVIIPTFDDKRAAAVVDHAIFLLNELIKKKITPTRSIYPKLIRACGRKALSNKLNLIFPTMSINNKQTQNNPMYFNAFIAGLYDDGGNFSNNSNVNISQEEAQAQVSAEKLLKMNSISASNNRLSIANLRSSLFNVDNMHSVDIKEILDKKIFLTYEFCPHCYKNKKSNVKKLNLEEVLGGFKRDKSCYFSICSICLCRIYPKLYIVYKENKINDIKESNISNNSSKSCIENIDCVNLLSPVVLLKEVDNLIKNHGEKYFFTSDYYRHKNHRQIFWNLAFYFEVLGLPNFVLYIQKDEEELNHMMENLEMIRYNAMMTSAKSNKTNNSGNNTRVNSIVSEITSRKQSSASNDVSSVYSGTFKSSNTNFITYGEYYKIIQTKILEKVELYGFNVDSDRQNEEKSDIMNNITEIRSVN